MKADTADRRADRKAARAKVLLAALVLGLALALGLGAGVAADRAEAHEKGHCTHDRSSHYGPDGRIHVIDFEYDWYTDRGWEMHKVSHWRKDFTGKWFITWTRSYAGCHDTVNA